MRKRPVFCCYLSYGLLLKDIHKNFYCKQVMALLLIAVISASSCSSTQEGLSSEEEPSKKQSDFGEVIGREWLLSQIQTITGPGKFSRALLEAQGMGDYYTLRFNEERLAGKGAPNRYTAPYQLGEWASISIQAVAGTMMAALREPPGLQEREYYDYLERVSRWSLEKDTLNLYTQDSSGESLVLIYQLRQE
jgi:heat shock protein HslJ